jgi:hypothetical protein
VAPPRAEHSDRQIASRHALPLRVRSGILLACRRQLIPDYRLHRAQRSRSVRDSEGFSVYDAIVDQIDWQDPTPWLSLLRALNDIRDVP